MALTQSQRVALTYASRPPGPTSFWYAVGSAVRQVGGMLDKLGEGIMGDCATNETRALPPVHPLCLLLAAPRGGQLARPTRALAGCSAAAPSGSVRQGLLSAP